MKKLCKLRFGSHLYGLSTPASDTDYKGIYLPTMDEYLLQGVPKTITANTGGNQFKNTNKDVDEQYFSLNYFLQLAFAGDTTTIDMLASPPGWEEITSPVWEDLKSKRHLFYTKNMRSFLGYCKSQSHKYGIKGSRLRTAEDIINWCNLTIGKYGVDSRTTWQEYLELINFPDKTITKENAVGVFKSYQEALYNLRAFPKGIKLYLHQNELPAIEYTKITYSYNEDGSKDYQNSYFHVFDKKFCLNDTVESLLNSISKFYESYGQRAELAKQNLNLDFKAISHAFRAGFQLKEIYQTGDLKYPLKNREFLLSVKQGKFHYINDGIAQQLEGLIDEVEELASKSSFPETVDKEYWNAWLLNTLKQAIV